MTRLVPSKYLCREHNRELTAEVLAVVEEDPSVTVNLGHTVTSIGLVEIGTFTVDVNCPGGDTAHVLRFMGSYQR